MRYSRVGPVTVLSVIAWASTLAACSSSGAGTAGGGSDAAVDSSHDSGHVDAAHDAPKPALDARTTDASHTVDAASDTSVARDSSADSASHADAPRESGGETHDAATHDAPVDAVHTSDVAAPVDAGLCAVTSPVAMTTPIVNSWVASPTAATVALGTSLTASGCMFSLAYTQSTGMGPPEYVVWLLKTDGGAGNPGGTTCSTDKGALSLGTSYGDVPTGALGANVAQKLLAVTFSYKFGLSGEDYQTSTLEQIDWDEGVILRQGTLVVKGQPNLMKAPDLVATGLVVAGCNVTVSGDGTVEAPADAGSGSTFSAQFLGFLAQAEQNGADADSAMNH